MTGAEYSNGSVRKYQLFGLNESGFHRFFNFEKVSHGKYKVLEIFKNPLPIKDGRSYGNNSVYTVYIELLLMHHLSKQGVNHVETFMKKDLWKMLGMVNEKYGVISDKEIMQINPLFTKFEIKNFYMRSNQKLERILHSALNNLKRKFLIEWELVTVIHKVENEKEKWVIATDDDKEQILAAKREILEKYNLKYSYQIYMYNKQNSFLEEVNDLLHERFGWDYFFKRYKIIFNVKNIQRAIPETEIELNKLLLNQKITSYLKHEARLLYDNSLKKYNDGIDFASNEDELKMALDKWKLPVNYVLAQNLLVDELISIDYDKNDGITSEQLIDIESEYAEIEQFFTLHFLDGKNLNV